MIVAVAVHTVQFRIALWCGAIFCMNIYLALFIRHGTSPGVVCQDEVCAQEEVFSHLISLHQSHHH